MNCAPSPISNATIATYWHTLTVGRMMTLSLNFLWLQSFSLLTLHTLLTWNTCFHWCKASGNDLTADIDVVN